MTYDKLETDAAEIKLGERALVARLYRAVVDEHDAAPLQRLDCCRHVRGAEADAHETLLPVHLFGAGRRLDQLQVELVARALEQRALGQHAEIPALRQDGEAEQAAVEVQPVARALAEDRLHDAEVMQAR